jgi:hypothetical protein
MIAWLRRKSEPPPEPTPEDCAWEVIESLLLDHPGDWEHTNYMLINKKTGIHIWTGNGQNHVRVALTHSECCSGGSHTEPPPKWKQKIFAAGNRIINPEAPEVVKIVHLEKIVTKVREAYI